MGHARKVRRFARGHAIGCEMLVERAAYMPTLHDAPRIFGLDARRFLESAVGGRPFPPLPIEANARLRIGMPLHMPPALAAMATNARAEAAEIASARADLSFIYEGDEETIQRRIGAGGGDVIEARRRVLSGWTLDGADLWHEPGPTNLETLRATLAATSRRGA